MSSAGPAPKSEENSEEQETDECATCDDDDRHGNPCTRPAIPGANYCTEHIGNAVDEDAEVLKEDGIILADDLTGKIVADTDSGARFELDVGDDIRLEPVEDDDTRHLTATELHRGLSCGDYYEPRNQDIAETVAMLADDGGAA